MATKKDDPDNDGRTQSGEKRQRGTQAARENADFYRKAISAILDELCGDDEGKRKTALKTWTKSESRGIEGVDTVEAISEAALPVVYGAKAKVQYKKRTGKDFELGAE